MIHAITSASAMPKRRISISKLSNGQHWRTDFMGLPRAAQVQAHPQAFLVEMDSGEVLKSHFHAVDQFQVFVGGAGSLGRGSEPLQNMALHYADHHTAYGPISAGPQGFAYFTLRACCDIGATYIDEPGYREKLKPSRRRHHMAPITLSIEPVLGARREAALESLIDFPNEDGDGLAAYMLRMGPRMTTRGPDPADSGGHYYLVMSGSLEYQGISYMPWSTLFVEPTETALEVYAGDKGLEALILQYSPQVN